MSEISPELSEESKTDASHEDNSRIPTARMTSTSSSATYTVSTTTSPPPFADDGDKSSAERDKSNKKMGGRKKKEAKDEKRAAELRSLLISRRDQVREDRRRKGSRADNGGLELSASMNTAICESERQVLDKGSWMHEIKDLNGSFSKLPPISSRSKVASSGQSFYVDAD